MLIKHALHYLAAGAAGLALTYGDRTPNAWGGDDVGYAGAGVLLISSGNASGDWAIDTDNYLVPSGVRADLGGAAVPKAYSAPSYALTVTDGVGFSKIVNITMLANDVTIRIQPKTGVFFDPNEWYEAHFILTLCLKGHNLWVRDGIYNESNSLAYTQPGQADQYGGVEGGRITVRSVNVDNSLRVDGAYYNRHGAKVNRIYYSPTAGGASPITYQYMHFYNNTVPDGFSTIFGTNGPCSEIFFDRCGFENGPALDDSAIGDCSGAIGSTGSSSMTWTNCTFYRLAGAIGHTGDNLVSHDNVMNYIRGVDCHSVGFNAFNVSVKRNRAWDMIPVNEGHCDFVQMQGIDNGAHGPLGEITDNQIYGVTAQLVFVSGVTDGGYTSGRISGNMGHNDSVNGILAQVFDAVTVEKNTVLSFDPTVVVRIAIEDGVDATVNKNISNAFDYIGQSGTTTITPNPQATIDIGDGTLSMLIANLVACFPGYVHPSVATDFSKAAMTLYFTPSVAYFAANGNSGCYDPTGAANAA